jgi:hypothetical protein
MSLSVPSKFVLPDLLSDCPYQLRTSQHREQVEMDTKQWLFKDNDNLQGQDKRKYETLKSGLLASMAYPTAAYPELRACNDFLTYLFHLDDISDEMVAEESSSKADVVLNVLYHPKTYRTPWRIAKLTQEYVLLDCDCIYRQTDSACQSLEKNPFKSVSCHTTTLC